MIAAIIWNSQDFHLIDPLPKDPKFNTSYYIDTILQSLLENRPTGPSPDFIIHVDNARLHTARKTLKFCQENGLRIGYIHRTHWT
jgi:hypothetical protein